MFRHKTKGNFSLQKLQKIQFLSTMAATLTKAKSEITVNAVRVKKLNMAELKSELSKCGLSASVKKEELLKRLAEAIREIQSESIDNYKANEPDMPLNKKNLTCLIKEILKEEYAK